jgi:hypothetical protein
MGADLITAAQFENLINEGIDDGDEDDYKLEGSDFWHEAHYGKEDYDLGEFGVAKYVVGETGGEGSAEYIWQVWSVTDGEGNTQFFKKEGYYMSYDGSNWDGSLFEVVPFEKTVTDWKVK